MLYFLLTTEASEKESYDSHRLIIHYSFPYVCGPEKILTSLNQLYFSMNYFQVYIYPNLSNDSISLKLTDSIVTLNLMKSALHHHHISSPPPPLPHTQRERDLFLILFLKWFSFISVKY